MTRKLVIEIETVRSGQPRAYADSEDEAIITARREGVLMGNSIFYMELKEETVKTITREFFRPFKDKPETPFDAKLVMCKAIGPTEEMRAAAHPRWAPGQKSRWRVVVREPYCD